VKILLDECVPADFRLLLRGHDAHSVQWAGLSGKKNGELLRLAELAGYEVLITVDQGIRYQQNLAGRSLAILVMRSATNRMKHLAPMVERVMNALETIEQGEIVILE
jgi:predicted nuclease of predicted toxin-antitoxin system